MKSRLAAITLGIVLGAASVPASAFAAQEGADAATSPEYARAMKRYERLLAEYAKNQAAYEADPGTWTAEVPRKPEKPAPPPAAEPSKMAR
jgi:hypothetical protein